MIIYLTTTNNTRTLRFFMAGCGAPMASRIRMMTYAEVLAIEPDHLPRGTWIFTDFDVFGARPALNITRLWQLVADRGNRVLNHPTRSMRRFELLRTLNQIGINDYDVRPAADPRPPRRFPVFVRCASDHSGPASPLLHDTASLQEFLRRSVDNGWPRDSLMVIELCDVREPSGALRTHGAIRVGERIIPDHLWFSDAWMIKERSAWRFAHSTVDVDALRAEERAYLAGNPHEGELRRIFDIARIEYGRIDYGMRDGRIQVWEINSNPEISDAWHAVDEAHRPEVRAQFGDRFLAALREIDS